MNSREMSSYLPRNELFSGLKGQNHDDVLTDDSDSVGLLVKRETRFKAKEVLQRERCLRLTLFEAVARVAVQLKVEAIWNQRNLNFSFSPKSMYLIHGLYASKYMMITTFYSSENTLIF